MSRLTFFLKLGPQKVIFTAKQEPKEALRTAVDELRRDGYFATCDEAGVSVYIPADNIAMVWVDPDPVRVGRDAAAGPM